MLQGQIFYLAVPAQVRDEEVATQQRPAQDARVHRRVQGNLLNWQFFLYFRKTSVFECLKTSVIAHVSSFATVFYVVPKSCNENNNVKGLLGGC